MWNNRDPTCGLVRTWYVQELEMAMLCNKNVTHTRTISKATGYSMYTWKASPTEAPASVAAPCHACQSSFMTINFIMDLSNSMTIYFLSQIMALLWQFCQIHHRYARVTRLLWQTSFCHKFVIKVKLWQIWLLQWRNLFVIEVDISSIRSEDWAWM